MGSDRLKKRLDKRKARSGGDDPLLAKIFSRLDANLEKKNSPQQVEDAPSGEEEFLVQGIQQAVKSVLQPYLSSLGSEGSSTTTGKEVQNTAGLFLTLDSQQQIWKDFAQPSTEEETVPIKEDCDDTAVLDIDAPVAEREEDDQPTAASNLDNFCPEVKLFSSRHSIKKELRKISGQEADGTPLDERVRGAVALDRLIWMFTKRVEAKENGRGKRGREDEEGQEATVETGGRQRTGAAVKTSGGSTVPLDSNVMQVYKDRFSAPGFASQQGGEDSDEWNRFLQVLKCPLPMALRFHEQPLQKLAVTRFKAFGLAPAKEILPENNGFLSFECPNSEYHADENADFLDFTKTLHSGGHLSFQEVVSMLPVIALGPNPGDRILDMCAAPGSKTLHVLDHLLQGTSKGGSSLVSAWNSSGMVVINEKDNIKATHTLPARLKRFGAPNIIISHCDASKFPRIQERGDRGGNNKGAPVLFDKIVCDVPCCGDGTVRKDFSVYKTWSTNYVNELVPIQESILRRGVELLAPGGTIVYSTCSMNPLEDECVVLKVLAMTFLQDDIELLDVNQLLLERGVTGLESIGGYVLPNAGEGQGKDSEFSREFLLAASSNPKMYDPAVLASEEARTEIAKKVLRVFPHRNNTGGFFVAAIKKKASAPVPEAMTKKLSHWAGLKKYREARGSHEEPHWKAICDFFGVEDSKLGNIAPMFHYTPNGAANRIFIATKEVVSTLFHRELYKSGGVEAVTAGVRLMEKLEDKFMAACPCRWRVASEGAHWWAQLATKRKVVIKHSDPCAKSLILLANLNTESFSPALAEAVGSLETGSVLIGLDLSGGDLPPFSNRQESAEEESTWWVTANLHPHGLELTADTSIRRAILRLVYETHMALE